MSRRLALMTFVSLVSASTFVVRSEPLAPVVAVLPRPAALTVGKESFTLNASTIIATDATLAHLGHQLAEMLGPATGFDLEVRTTKAPKTNLITLREDPTLAQTLGAEGYRLEVTVKAVTIRAGTPAGIFYGLQTLRELL